MRKGTLEARNGTKLWAVAVAALVAISGGQAAGQEARDPNKQFNEGLDLAREGKTLEAIGLWVGVLDEVEERFRPSVHKALGLAFHSLGRSQEAVHHLRSFLGSRMEGEELEVRALVLELEDELRKGHRSVTIACDPGNARVYHGRSAEGTSYPCPLTWWFKPGRHFVHVTSTGYVPVTEEVDVAEQCTQTVKTVVLRAVGVGEQPVSIDPAELQRRILTAVEAGHTSVLKRLAEQHPEVFKGLSCDKAWVPAVQLMSPSDCLEGIFKVLMDSGAQLCPTSTWLERAGEFGCPEVVSIMLPLLSDPDVLTAVAVFSAPSPSQATPEQVDRALRVCDLLSSRTRPLCKAQGPDSAACQYDLSLETERRGVFEALAAHAQPETLIQVLSSNPALAREYACDMTRKVLELTISFDDCARVENRLSLFYEAGPKECSLGEVLTHSVQYLCTDTAARLVPDVVAEDLATAARKFNEGNWYFNYGLTGNHANRYPLVVKTGKLLVEANKQRCAKDGPTSVNCVAATLVEKELAKLDAEKQRRESPEAYLKAACASTRDLELNAKLLAHEKKIAASTGTTTNLGEIETLTRSRIHMQAGLDEAAANFKKASGKKFKASMCKDAK